MHDDALCVADLLAQASAQLAAARGLNTREARLEARVLAAFAWDVSAAWLIAHDRDPVPPERLNRFSPLLARRLAGEPVAYLTGTREFYGRSFRVTPDVLIPRPDTELLVERALAWLPPGRSADLLDLGTGSGCIAVTLALENPLARVVAVDQSAAALAVARHNARALDAAVEWLHSNWYSGLTGRRFDAIVSNPPYVAAADPHLTQGDVHHEPRAALAAGPTGLDALDALIRDAPAHLKPAGILLLEHGFEQAAAVQARLRQSGFVDLHTWSDLAGHPRVTGGRVSE